MKYASREQAQAMYDQQLAKLRDEFAELPREEIAGLSDSLIRAMDSGSERKSRLAALAALGLVIVELSILAQKEEAGGRTGAVDPKSD